MTRDLDVEIRSHALQDIHLDLLVTGSIGAVESVRLIRSLRRLGANVSPWLSEGGAQFVTEVALSWAANHPTRLSFEGTQSHTAEKDALVVAPASANFLSQLSHGITGTPGLALAASYLGSRRPVILIPNMHESLASSPMVAGNLEKMSQLPGLWLLQPRQEEAKWKFPEPAQAALQMAHLIRKHQNQSKGKKIPRVLVTLGSTRAPIDPVRYLANSSTGALGSLIIDELYAFGWEVSGVQGPSQVKPLSSGLNPAHTDVETYEQMKHATMDVLNKTDQNNDKSFVDACVFAAAVLDYLPQESHTQKISSQSSSFSLTLKPTEKIVGLARQKLGQNPMPFVVFKLETELNPSKMEDIIHAYSKKYEPTLMVMNQKSDVSETQHVAFVYEYASQKMLTYSHKRDLARAIAQHVRGEALS